MSKSGRGDDQYMVRFPDGMRDLIKAQADRNGRSMNTEIIIRLEESLKGHADLHQMVAEIHAAVKPNRRYRFRPPILQNEEASDD